MSDRVIGQVKRVNGPVIEVMGITDAEMFELVRVGRQNLIGELIKLESESAVIQVYEDTTGIAPHDPVYGAGIQLSAELGPGMVGTIYDGIQRPLVAIREQSGIFIDRGITVPSLDRDKKWHFVPGVQPGDRLSGGRPVPRRMADVRRAMAAWRRSAEGRHTAGQQDAGGDLAAHDR